jgi:pimeloyl-ACP methyl ester carboxylesterase
LPAVATCKAFIRSTVVPFARRRRADRLSAWLAWQFQKLGVPVWAAPGFGQSELVPASIDAYVEALRELIAEIGQPKVSLVGHSMGGTVAARFAATFPKLVSRLVLSRSHAGYGDPETAPMSAKFERRMREFDEVGPFAYGVNRARDLLPDSVSAGVFDYAAEIASDTNPEGLRGRRGCCSLPTIVRCCPNSKCRFSF